MIVDDPSKRMSWEEFLTNPIINTEPDEYRKMHEEVSKDEKSNSDLNNFKEAAKRRELMHMDQASITQLLKKAERKVVK